MRADIRRESNHPIGQGLDAFRRYRGESGSGVRPRLLRDDKVKNADDIVDVSALGGFRGDPMMYINSAEMNCK